MFHRIVFYVDLKICFFQANGNVGFGGLNLVFFIILSEIII
jgi:hypothetical protein